jgi:hypothetical protein
MPTQHVVVSTLAEAERWAYQQLRQAEMQSAPAMR